MMTDLNEWIKERRRIHNAATEGPWAIDGPAQAGPDDSLVVYPKDDAGAIAYVQPAWDDADAIVDAHNTLPNLLTAVENVLEVLDGWEPPDPCSLEGDPCLDCLMINEMRRAIEGAINE